MEAFTPKATIFLVLLLVGNSCLVTHVFLLNDWLGMGGDLQDPNRAHELLRLKTRDVVGIGRLCVALLASSLLLLGSLGFGTFVCAIVIATLSALYSGPVLHGKGIPIVSSMLHLIGGVLHFLLGYSVFCTIDARGIEIACFFALAFAAGHLTQEARDYDVDLANGIGTNAVAFGKTGSFAAGFVLFTIADLLLLVLAVRGTLPRVLALAAVLYPIHAYWSFRVVRAGLGFESIRRFQIGYRGRYVIIGLAMTIAFLRAH
jgi:4-hydroxybenzoate polyprenyltransferase